jgi:hypothetical protein
MISSVVCGPGAMNVLVMREVWAFLYDSRRLLPLGAVPMRRPFSLSTR